MFRSSFYLRALPSAVFLLSCSYALADKAQDYSAFLKECASTGNTLESVSELVVDFEQATGLGPKSRSFCIRNYKCSIPSRGIVEFKGKITCAVDPDGNCESLNDCGRNTSRNTSFGFADSVNKDESGYMPTTARNCTEVKGPTKNMVFSMFEKVEKSTDYRTMCIKSLSCKLPSGAEEVLPLVACLSTGRKIPRSGGGPDVDECYGPNECFDRQLQLPNEAEYKKYLANKRKLAAKAVSSTMPRNSQTQSEFSSSGECSSESLVERKR